MKNKDLKKGGGQASIEMFVVFAIVILLGIIFSIFIYNKAVQGNAIKEDIEGRKIAGFIGTAIDDVYIAGDGYSKEIKIPGDISEKSYRIKFHGGEAMIFLNTEDSSWAETLSTPNVKFRYDGICSSPFFDELNVTNMTIVLVGNNNSDIHLTIKGKLCPTP